MSAAPVARSYGVIDAWIQPWTEAVAAVQPERNWALVDRYGGDTRLRSGIPIDTMIDEMDAAGIAVALCSAGPLVPVSVVEEAVARHPDRLLGVGYADPFTPDGVMVAVHELRRQVGEQGFVGLKLEPFIGDRPLTLAQWYPLYAACCDLGITLQVQVGNTGPPSYPSETGRPLYVDRVAIDFPDLRIVAGHIGWPWTEEMIAVAEKHPNVWIDTSAHLPKHYPERFVNFLRKFGRDKCIWASDWPILDFERPLRGVADLDLPADVERAFLRDNAIAAFTLDARVVNFGLDDREREWRDEIRAFVDGVGGADVLGFRREMAELEVERHAPTFYRMLAERGWVGLGWPEPHGRPASETERFVLHEEIDTAGLPMYGVEINEAIGWMLVRHGSDELRAEHLPRIVHGDTWYAGAYSEPEAGSDLLALKTRGVREGDVLRVSGSKLWTSSAHLADFVFAIVRTDPDANRHRGLSIVLIDTRLPGVEITPVPVMGGWRVNLCFFDDVEVPVANVVGEIDHGWSVLAEALDVERAMSFGGREGRLWLARFLHRCAGRADDLGEARLEELGRLVADLEVERLLGLRLAAIGERGAIADAEASMAKVFGSELAQREAQWLADALAPESLYEVDRGEAATDQLAADMEEMLRVSTVYTVIGGTSEVQRNTIAARGLGLPRG